MNVFARGAGVCGGTDRRPAGWLAGWMAAGALRGSGGLEERAGGRAGGLVMEVSGDRR